MNRIKLIAFDLDGTALNSQGQLAPATLEALQAAHNKGCLLAVATGRPKAIVPPCIWQLPFVRFVACASGATVLDLPAGELLRQLPLTKKAALTAAVLAKRQGAAISVSFLEKHYMEWKMLALALKTFSPTRKKGASLAEFWNMASHTTFVRSGLGTLRKQGEMPVKLECFFPAGENMEQKAAQFNAIGGVCAVQGMGTSLEITAKTATKGDALAFLCGRFGIAPGQVLAIGDAENDLSMRKAAGLFVAMGNATQEVKAAADYVTTTADNNGVAKALAHLLPL